MTTGFEFLSESYDDVVRFIEGKKAVRTRKNYFSIVKQTLKNNHTPVSQWAIEAYDRKFKALSEEVKTIEESQEQSEREKKAMMNWPDIVECARKFIAEALLSEEISVVQDAVMMACYTLMPPRRLDYCPMAVLTRKPKEKINYLLIHKKSKKFVFNQYKTANVYGEQVVPVPKDMEEILGRWLEMNVTGWLFIKENGEPMNENSFSKMLIRLFESKTDKKIGVDILRHSYISWERRDEKFSDEIKQLATKMSHSVNMNQLYRKKST